MKQEKPKLVIAEVIDHVISLHMGENVYKSFFKGAIVEIEPVTFRNLERKGRVRGAAVPAVGTTGVSPVENKSRSRGKRSKTTGETPIGPTGRMPAPQEAETASPEGDAV